MRTSSPSRLTRSLTLLLVAFAHLALIAALIFPSRTLIRRTERADAIEVLLLPRTLIPRIRADQAPPHEFNGRRRLAVDAPALGALAMPFTSSSSSAGRGSGVDWMAEAQRALRAYEIRHTEGVATHALSSDPREDDALPRSPHRAGDQFRTATGDWIVWIDADCYQVAGSGSTPYAQGVTRQTTCRDRSASTP